MDQYNNNIDKFKAIVAELAKNNNLADKFREQAFAEFEKAGIPDKTIEAYKYTDLRKHFDQPMNIVAASNDLIIPQNLPDIDADKIYTVNGRVQNADNLIVTEKLIYGDLSSAITEMPVFLSKYYNVPTHSADGNVPLNTSLATAGVFIYIPDGMQLDKPLLIINTVNTTESSLVIQRNTIVIGEKSKAQIAIINIYKSQALVTANTVSEIVLNSNSSLDILRVQTDNDTTVRVSSDFIVQHNNSNLNFTDITCGGKLVRNNINVDLKGTASNCNLNGLVVAVNNSHVDNSTNVNHIVHSCSSNELYKCIVNHSAASVFKGKIKVAKDAQKTIAKQTNKNLIVGSLAKAYTKPQLEIYADDVECSHGATIGQLSDEALFYMKSRGISAENAQMLLISGFASEICSKITNPDLFAYTTSLIDNSLV